MNIYNRLDDEFIIELRQYIKNNPLTKEDKVKGEGIKPVHTPILFGRDNGFYGKKHTDEAKEKIRQKKIGTKFSPEVIEKLKKRFPGTSHPMSKLSETQIMEIYNLAWEGNLTQKQIAEMYNVRQGHITKIKNGKMWVNITNHNNVL